MTRTDADELERVDGAAPHTRGFLFSDLRGYSAFTERHGDRAARDLLTRYRQLVREVIASAGGAEIRTEGDSFYVVFDSVSEAVRAGLAILQVTADDAQPHPIPVGIGVHAGETEDSAEGIVSSAVNIAARVCSVAEPGELLVSDTVRSLTRTYLDVTFVPRGRRRLKGITEPINLYRVVAGTPPPAARRRALLPLPRWLAVGGAAAALAVAVGAVAVLGGTLLREGRAGADESSAPPSDSASLTAHPSTATTSPDPGAMTADEERLLEFVQDSDREKCAPLKEGPNYLSTAGRAFDEPPYPVAIAIVAGIDCALGGISGPDRLQLWQLPAGGASDPGAPDNTTVNPAVLVSQKAGTASAPRGSCSQEVPALEDWSFGGGSGVLVCYETRTGDAVLWWTYDGTDLIATAVRDDQDMAALLEWWASEARFGP